MANGKSVTKKKDNVVALVSNDMLFEDQGAGQEGIESQDLMIPRITILQSMSPQVNKRDGQYVDSTQSPSQRWMVKRASLSCPSNIVVRTLSGKPIGVASSQTMAQTPAFSSNAHKTKATKTFSIMAMRSSLLGNSSSSSSSRMAPTSQLF